MAKNKSGKTASETTTEAAAVNQGNGDLLFEDMGEGFSIPSARSGVSLFDTTVKQLLADEKNGNGTYPVRCIFKQEVSADKEQSEKGLMKCYTRAKQLKNAAKRLEVNITVATRKVAMSPAGLAIHGVLAQKNADQE